MRCTNCGNVNPDLNRFCGMCGASLFSSSAPGSAQQHVSVSTSAPVEVASESARDTARSTAQTPPSIPLPSFLGLNDAAPSKARNRARLSVDPHAAPGSNLDYLLDEEEPPHHWGVGKILLILIALALALGFGYLRWKNQGLAWLNGLKKPSAAVQNSTAPDGTTAPATSPSITPDTQTSTQPIAAAPQSQAATPAIAPTDSAAATPAPATSTPATPPPTDSPKSTEATPASTSDKPDSPSDKDASAAKETAHEAPAPPQPAEKPRPSPRAPTPKPSPATKRGSFDPVTESQKYLYGRGASQDCDRGMRLLKPEASKSNPKAMVEMGALYSAGLCTPRDLPTAYRWFALALRKDPDNLSVQADLQKLWGEMTQPERQLAIKLTQ